MPWALFLDLRFILGAALILTAIYAKVQSVRVDAITAEYAQFRADVESEAAKAKVRNAQEAARQAQNAQEVVSDLQTRFDALSVRYKRLRADANSRPMPALSDAASLFGSCPQEPSQPDPTPRLLGEIESRVTGVLEEGDREIAKYVELWKLQKKNAAAAP